MLQELINLTNKAKGTDYEVLFQQIYELTLEIEVVYMERFPTNANKIIYFHERFTRAFVDTYALLMQNVEETSVTQYPPENQKNYAEFIADQIEESMRPFYKETNRLILGSKVYVPATSEQTRKESERVWSLRHKLKESRKKDCG